MEIAPTLADGQQTDSVGRHALRAILPVVERAVGITDNELVVTMRFVSGRLRS